MCKNLQSFDSSDADGALEAVVPVCGSAACADGAIYGLKNDKVVVVFLLERDHSIGISRLIEVRCRFQWVMLGSDFIYENVRWKFVVPEADSELLKSMQQPTLRIADLNMDGFPDILTIMYSEQDGRVTNFLIFCSAWTLT